MSDSSIYTKRSAIYVAGPWVFAPNAKGNAELIKNIFSQYGYEALLPLSDKTDYRDIYYNNLALMNQADIIIADISPFRGVHADPGTAFEIGYAKALGLRIYLYSSDMRMIEDRIYENSEDFGRFATYGLVYDKDDDGYLIEFGVENLMLTYSSDHAIYPSVFDALLGVYKDDEPSRTGD